MKASLKNSNGAVRFLLRHGEKIGIVLLLALAGMLFYSSLGRDRLATEQLPPALQSSASNARTHIEQMSWDNFPPEEVVPDASTIATSSGSTVVEEGLFPTLPRINPPVVPPVEPREDPVLLTLADLEVSTGSGIWATANADLLKEMRLAQLAESRRELAAERAERERMEREEEEGRGRRRGRDEDDGGYGREGGYGGLGEITRSGAMVVRPSGGAMTQGFEIIRSESWVTVKAVVPLREQFELYKDAFENARGYSESDFPEYFGYQIQRAEMTGEGQGEWELLGSFTGKTLIREISGWPVQTPEVVHEKYVHPLLTFPLPPMVLRTWGEEVTHSSMPLPTPEELMYPDGMTDETADQPADETAEGSDDPFARRRPQPGQAGVGGYGGRGEFGGGYGGREFGGGYGGREFGGGYGGREFGGGYGGREYGGAMMGLGGGYGMSEAGDIELPQYVWDGKTKKLLFRFFDSSVEPGGRYKYRVRLVITDPNVNMPPQYLAADVGKRLAEERAASAKGLAKGYRFTEWSEPSPVAVVPPPGLIYVAGASPATESNYSSEPEAEIIVKTLDAVNAAEAAIREEFTRGSVINLRDYAKVIWSNAFQVDQDKEEPQFDFRTGVTLLDIAGGGQIKGARDLNAPARALLMDSGGRLTIEDELEDYDVVREYVAIVEAADEARRRESERDRDRGRGEFGGRR